MNIAQRSPLWMAVIIAIGSTSSYAASYDFNAESKSASSYTKSLNEKVLTELPFNNDDDFQNANKGFIAPLIDGGLIKGVADIPAMQFMMDKEAPAEVNPSLWRHAQLVNRGGLYEVMKDKIYQIRGADLANLTIIETDNGIILYDLCFSPITMKKAYELYEKYRGKRPLKGIIISHSHTDHFGGISAVTDMGLATKEEIASGKVPIYVPKGFLEEAVGENVLFGNVMSRRAMFQYGFALPKGTHGTVTNALGPLTPGGANGLPSNVTEITSEKNDVTIDGVEFNFMLVPESEAPAEMVFYIPEWKALSMAEDVNRLQHNVYSMRGAKIRDAGRWAKYIHEAVVSWGGDVEVEFGPHTWPMWGNNDVVSYLKNQRDLYKAINDQTNRLANYGYRPRDIAEKIEIPDAIMKKWENRDYYGHFENNVIATYVRNLGWFNANPTELARLPDAESGKRFVQAFGSENEVIEKALDFYNHGDYRFTVELLNKIVSYNGENKKANYLMADAFEQLGYQEESTLARGWYLTAAAELRSDEELPQAVNTAGVDVLKSIPADLMMDVFATRIVPEKSVEVGRLAFQLKLNGKQFGVEVENGVLNSALNYKPDGSSVDIETDNLTIFSILSGNTTIQDAIDANRLKVSGNGSVFEDFISVLDNKIPSGFNLVKPLND
ncbi:TPA: alkyl/aryl-sulfatase [Vibrio parahaemolyticus]